ncbi:MAG TPA: DUF4445 domain-containing protein [Thermoplasmata archaeon]|nr:DUF4445 domain-containing protein [Thermoplasmata archaeon]
MKFRVKFEPVGREAKVEKGKTIYEAAQEENIRIRSICGGNGLCGKCKVIVSDLKKVNEVTEIERRLLSGEELKEGYRLACLTKVFGNNSVEISKESIPEKHRILIGGKKRKFDFKPKIRKLFVELPRPSIQDPRSDLERVKDTLKEKTGFEEISFSYKDLKELPSKIREKNFLITCFLRDSKVVKVKPGVARENIYGIAIDVGTTTVVAYLLDLEKGNLIASGAITNPQISYSEDIIGRLSCANKSGYKLSKVLIDGLDDLIKDICKNKGIDPKSIYEGVFVGNTVMHHMLLGLSTKHLSVSPYLPVLNSPIELEAPELGINTIPNAQIFFPPLIGGFIGSDHVAVILASEIHKAREPILAMDLGTNTEISLGKEGHIFCCSAAAGPAFEGGRIKHGVRASDGAIEEVKIDPETYEVKYKTINNKKPKGLCGSGLIDLVAEFLRAGVIAKDGRMQAQLPCIKKGEKGPEFVISSEGNKNVSISQKDIRQLQLAKSAVHTGIKALMDESGTTIGEIKKVFLAGAFGNYVKPSSAKVLGLIPPVSLKKVENIGNAAGSGAQIMILSKKERESVAGFINKIKRVELAARPDFQRKFITNTEFGWN